MTVTTKASMKANMKATASRYSSRQLFSALIVFALVMGLITYYATWWWIVKPQNQQRFSQQVERNVESYNQAIENYLSSLKISLATFATEVPNGLLLIDTPSSSADTSAEAESDQLFIQRLSQYSAKEKLAKKQQQWVDTRTAIWQIKIPEVTSLKLFSMSQINDISFSTSSVKNTEKLKAYGVNFLFLDMVNRLNDQKPIYVEAAKTADKNQWELHYLAAVNDEKNNAQGVLYVTLSLQGLKSALNSMNTSLGKLTVAQKIDKKEPLIFFSVGSVAETMNQKIRNVRSNYWQINYQPSVALEKKSRVFSVHLWSVVIGLPLLALFFGVLLIMRLLKKTQLTNKSARNGTVTNKPHSEEQSPDIKKEIGKDPVIDTETKSETKSEIKAPDLDSEKIIHNKKDEIVADDFPDTIFRAYDIRGLAYEELSHDLMYAIGQAFATEVLLAGETSAIVAWDARTHSQEFSVCLLKGMHSTGCNTIDIGVAPTPLMNFSACEHEKTSSGIIITASHNPKDYNGCKMVVKGKTLVDDGIQRIKERIKKVDVTASEHHGESEKEDFSQRYIDRVISDVAVIDGWKVVVDAGNGASSELAPRLMNALECETHPLYCHFDGEFPNHDPDPSVADNLKSLIDTVTKNKADIGFALDGDGDRLTAVTASGKIVWPDQLMMLFAQDIVERNPGCDVVFDIKSSQLLAQIISENGGRPVMWKTGHSHIKAKMHETQALLGGEFSGHIFFKERWYGFDDGLYAAARLLEILTLAGQTLDELVDALPQRVSTPEIKIVTTEQKKFAIIDQFIEKAEFTGGQRTTIDGLRVDFVNGWGLVRASNTAPVLTLRFEASSVQELEKIKQQFKEELIKVDATLAINF